MAEIQAIHECLFCPQTFGSAAAKDDHVLEHFAQETCLDCNRSLIRIGGSLYTKHDSTICIERTLKIEAHIEPPTADSFATQNHTGTTFSGVKHAEGIESDPSFSSTTSVAVKEEEQQNASDNDSMDFMDEHQNYSPDPKSNGLHEQPDYSPHIEPPENYLPPSEELESQRIVCKEETEIETESLTQNVESVFGQYDSSKSNLSKQKSESHSSDNTAFCSLCGRLFNTIKERDVHTIDCSLKQSKNPNPNKNEYLRCEICQIAFKTDVLYRQHMRLKHNQNVITFKCSECYTKFSKVCWLNQHPCSGKATGIGEKSRFACEVCKKEFGFKQSLQRHQLRVHPSTVVSCKVCKKSFGNKEELNLHKTKCMKVKHQSKRTTESKCIKCLAVFESEALCESHDCPNKDAYLCSDCNKNFSGPGNLRLHQIRFHSSDDAIFCTVCGHLFSAENERDQHQLDCILKRKISQQKLLGQFECDICQTKIRTKASLRRHMLTKHNPNADKFKCKLCKAVFMRESSHQHHMCRGKRQNTEQSQLIPCEACGKVLSRGAMNTHRTIFHSPGAKYCRTCFKIFPCDDTLKTHMMDCALKSRLTNKRPCDVCGKVLAGIKSLARHKLSLHSPPDVIFCKTCVRKFKTLEELNAHTPDCSLKRKIKRRKT